MRIAFVDVSRLKYTIDTAYREPLGGSHSALCYLAEKLAQLGHDVRLFNSTDRVSVSRGITCAPLNRIATSAWRELDVVILQNWSKLSVELKSRLHDDARLLLWTQHADDQPAMHALSLPEVRGAFDRFVFVSDWQRQRYAEVYGIPTESSFVLRNAISPAFEQNPDAKLTLLDCKAVPPMLAYTSTPFRGLATLLDVFPSIRESVPDTRLQVYSSMQVYQVAAERDQSQYGTLYERCRSTEGVEYVGSLPQPALADRLRQVAVLAYPNDFAETSCIAAMEAMASGCAIVATRLGALPETTAGHAALIDLPTNTLIYREQFVEAVVNSLNRFRDDRAAWQRPVGQSFTWAQKELTWANRALEWQAFLDSLLQR